MLSIIEGKDPEGNDHYAVLFKSKETGSVPNTFTLLDSTQGPPVRFSPSVHVIQENVHWIHDSKEKIIWRLCSKPDQNKANQKKHEASWYNIDKMTGEKLATLVKKLESECLRSPSTMSRFEFRQGSFKFFVERKEVAFHCLSGKHHAILVPGASEFRSVDLNEPVRSSFLLVYLNLSESMSDLSVVQLPPDLPRKVMNTLLEAFPYGFVEEILPVDMLKLMQASNLFAQSNNNNNNNQEKGQEVWNPMNQKGVSK